MLVASLPVAVTAAALLYMWGMAALEGSPRGFWSSLEWASETLSTTGYGADVAWRHPLMVLLVIGLQFAGVFLVFLIFPVYLIPFLEERFETRLASEVRRMEGHLVVYRHGPGTQTLLQEAAKAGLAAVVVETDVDRARRFDDSVRRLGHRLVQGCLDDGVLGRVCLDASRALIANGSDDENAAAIVTARQHGFAGDVLALVEEPFHREAMRLAGASAVFTPRHILGAALAARASERIRPTVAGLQQLGERLEVRDVRLERDSPLAGRTLGEADLGQRARATVIGQWVGGELEMASPEMRLRAGGILVMLGEPETLDRLAEVCAGTTPLRRTGAFLVAGHGEVGRKVVELLLEVGEEVRVVDRRSEPGVDVVGDMLDPSVARAAGVAEARAVILALDADTATLFATVIVKDLAPVVPVIARVNQAENVERIHRAGADFALSLSQVAGQMLVRRLLGEEALALDSQLRVARVSGAGATGRRLRDLGLRERTGCSVAAVARGADLLVRLEPDFLFEAGDDLFVVGSGASVHRLEEALARG